VLVVGEACRSVPITLITMFPQVPVVCVICLVIHFEYYLCCMLFLTASFVERVKHSFVVLMIYCA
jgi:hypothetical protein